MEFDSFVLTASTADLGAVPRARTHADIVEFRMDLADDPLDTLSAYDGDLPVLATNRASWEGGEATDDDERLDALAAAAERYRGRRFDSRLRDDASAGETSRTAGRRHRPRRRGKARGHHSDAL